MKQNLSHLLEQLQLAQEQKLIIKTDIFPYRHQTVIYICFDYKTPHSIKEALLNHIHKTYDAATALSSPTAACLSVTIQQALSDKEYKKMSISKDD